MQRSLMAGASAALVGMVLGPTAQAREIKATDASAIEELVVTAERREATLQQVPLAVSAFSGEALRAGRLDGPRDLLQAVPNVNYSRSNFGGYNLSIRGIGSKFIGLSGEYGVSIHENATPFTFSRLADAEFFDVERVELLRGPQGALYGRNATGGALNVITARPADTFGGQASAEYGNYNSVRLQGALNIPLNEMMAVRFAGFVLKRDGFTTNTATGRHVDDRDIGASRLSFRLHPNETLDLNVMWERFDEKDSRSRVGKPLCIKDPGPSALGAVPVLGANRGFLSQGCLPGSRRQDAAYGTVNSAATLGGLYLPLTGLAQGDLFAGQMQDAHLRRIESALDPVYAVHTNFYQIDAKLRVSPKLTLESLTGFSYDRSSSYQDYLRVVPDIAYSASALFPGGFVNDPQVGRSNTLRSFDYYPTQSKEFTQEVRLSSVTGGAWDFNAGALHREYSVLSHYYVFSNGLTAFSQLRDILAGFPNTYPIYIDPGFPADGSGHNYYDNQSVNRARSNSIFGEIYWRPASGLKLTLGLRTTRDHKESEPSAVTLLAPPTLVATPPASGQRPNPAFNGGIGHPPAPRLVRNDQSTTGRLNLDWTPKLSFTDRTMVYASYSRGYKAGGFNTPCDLQSPGCGSVPTTFAPEFVDAYEIGTKNVLAGGRLLLNLTAFHYDYRGYQVSSTINKSSVNQNIDARIDGLELESVWEPVQRLRFNLSAGWLKTRIRGGTVLDTFDRAQGDPRLAIVKAQDGANCLVNRAALASLVAIQQRLPGAPTVAGITGNPSALLGACSGLYSSLGLYDYAGMNVTTAPIAVDRSPAPNAIVNVGQGVLANLDGNRLPNAPDWTLAVGAQYGWEVEGWLATLRGDYYRQGGSYARIFNTGGDKLRGYQIVNATLTIASPGRRLDVQLFVKNLTNSQPMTDAYLTDDSSGLFTNTFTLEPRTYGVAVTQRF
ncbi:TonB-dependent receptor [Phenylobacterium sp. LjRoot225]|uniref:TonB-dependent receptor n=1 Tax=Phenylobacterium sp. LjRoot225 TaxID=3342285 RepID=UPI003ECD1B79